jgi:hypothetical protein
MKRMHIPFICVRNGKPMYVYESNGMYLWRRYFKACLSCLSARAESSILSLFPYSGVNHVRLSVCLAAWAGKHNPSPQSVIPLNRRSLSFSLPSHFHLYLSFLSFSLSRVPVAPRIEPFHFKSGLQEGGRTRVSCMASVGDLPIR